MNEPSPSFLAARDAGTRGAGEILRHAREAQGITLEALASMIKVTPAKLEALEQGRHDQLPDANFTRALAMTVCRALKIDPSEVLAALPAARPTPLAEGKPPLNQPFKEAKSGTPLFDRHALNWSALLTPKYLAPAVLLVGAVLVYTLPDSVFKPVWQSSPSGSPSGAPSERGAPSSVTQTVPVQPAVAPAGSAVAPGAAPLSLDPAVGATSAASAGEGSAGVQAGAVGQEGSAAAGPGQPGGPATFSSSVAPAMPVAPGAQPEPRLQASTGMAPQPLAATAPVAPAGAGSLSIALAKTSWIEVRDAQGRKVFSGLAQAGDNLSLDGPAPLQVRIGNVSAVQMRYKGQPVDLSAFSRNNVARIELK